MVAEVQPGPSRQSRALGWGAARPELSSVLPPGCAAAPASSAQRPHRQGHGWQHPGVSWPCCWGEAGGV